MTDLVAECSPSLTVTVAVWVPAGVYVCDGFCWVDAGVPSPKSQL